MANIEVGNSRDTSSLKSLLSEVQATVERHRADMDVEEVELADRLIHHLSGAMEALTELGAGETADQAPYAMPSLETSILITRLRAKVSSKGVARVQDDVIELERSLAQLQEPDPETTELFHDVLNRITVSEKAIEDVVNGLVDLYDRIKQSFEEATTEPSESC